MSIPKISILLLLGFHFLMGWAQNYLPFTEVVLQNEAGTVLPNPWTGGLETPQYGSIDFNQDGWKDMVVFDNQAERFLSFLNPGRRSNTLPIFSYTPSWDQIFSDCGCRDWAVFVDYTCDGLPDLLCRTQTAEVGTFRQELVGDDSIRFTSHIPRVELRRNESAFPLTVAPTDIPAIADVDYDGDLDFFAFGVGSNFIQYARNDAMEELGRCDTLLYTLATSCWGHFRESDEDNTAFVADTVNCPLPEDFRPQTRAIQHVGSTTLLLDLNADSTFDALIGDTAFDEVYALYNSGTPTYAFMDSVERNFPQLDRSISVATFPACFYEDVTNDGIRDLLVAPHSASSFDNTAGTWLYIDSGESDAPTFQFEKVGYLQDGMLDLGTYSYPTVGDVTGDGLPDLLVGNRGYFALREPTLESALALLENIGTPANPSFRIADGNFLNIRGSERFLGLTEIHPTIGDLTGDQIPDILLGNEQGTLYFFQGILTTGSTRPEFTFMSDSFGGIDVGRNSAPFLYDVDQDNDLDLLIGNRAGYIQYYQNQGISDIPEEIDQGPIFELITETWGNVRILDEFGGEFSRGFANPFLLDIDQDEEVELLLGGVQGFIEVYDNVSQALTSTLPLIGNLGNLDFGQRVVPAGGIFEAGEPPLIWVGNRAGGLQILRNSPSFLPTSSRSPANQQSELLVYPNPSKGEIQLQWKNQSPPNWQVSIRDILGRSLYQGSHSGKRLDLNLQSFGPGTFLLQILVDDQMFIQRILLE
ncbi:MAG: T9SS type A sorting domain-containing protein [Bacteroidota bacterium]